MARRYTLQEIKNGSSGHFFDRDTMKFFRASGWKTAVNQTKYGTRYDKETGTNYLVVTDPWGKRHFHKFDPKDGSLTFVSAENVPSKVREK